MAITVREAGRVPHSDQQIEAESDPSHCDGPDFPVASRMWSNMIRTQLP
jgi:hypothetical protein